MKYSQTLIQHRKKLFLLSLSTKLSTVYGESFIKDNIISIHFKRTIKKYKTIYKNRYKTRDQGKTLNNKKKVVKI